MNEVKVPKLDRNKILKVSADPQAGFIRGFLNEKLWAFDASWVPFRWFHHLPSDDFRRFSRNYPPSLPGQVTFPTKETQPTAPPNPFNSITTGVDAEALKTVLTQLSAVHRKRSNPPK